MSLALAQPGDGCTPPTGALALPDSRPVVPTASVPLTPSPDEKSQPAGDARRPAPHREFAYKLVAAFLVTDWLVATAAIFSGLAFREWQRSTLATEPGVSLGFLLAWSMPAAIGFVWLMALSRTYEIKTSYNISLTLRNVFKTVFLWSISLWAFVGFFRVTGFVPRLGAIYCMITLAGFMAFWRVLAFLVLTSRPVRTAASSRVLMVGWSKEAGQVRDAMKLDVSLLGDVIGCVSGPAGRPSEVVPADVPQLGDYASLTNVIRHCRVNLLILADTSCAPEEIQRLTLLCEREMIQFSIILDYFPTLRSRLHVLNVSGVPLLSRSELPIDSTLNRFVKRGIDILGALVGLLLSSLIVPWFCLLVFLESPGPVFFRQRRTSRSGHSFHIYKIRSMKINAEAGTGAVWCKQNDDRRLRVGTFMRRWNIDELPQFFNVLIGDMSLVGPRPERPELIERFKEEIPSYNLRHEVRTGLTGWAQIQGLRGDTDLRKRIEADLYYLENWSVSLDLYCIAATLFKVKNAH